MGLYPLCCLNSLIAFHFRLGVSHSFRSTPAVRLPWFSVTRRTARALALNEWVKDLCKAFTLRQSFSCVAFVKRICVVLTLHSTRCQSMACQSCGSREDAESSLLKIFLMLSSWFALRTRISPKGFPIPSGGLNSMQSSTTVAPRVEVSTLSRQGKF